jgi:uncharacterized protein YndB with AHSA1/START domain
MPVTDVDKDIDALTMTITAKFDADAERLWELWSDPRQLERWWSPPSHSSTFVEHELTVGARTTYFMTGPDGEKHHGRISAAAPDARVILFGSYARDEADSQSDLDLLVIEPEVENAAMESVRLHRALRGLGVPADVVVVDEDLARRRSVVAGTMVERALREGRVLVNA